MRLLRWNRVVDLLIYLIAACAVATGLLLAYRLPPGSRGGRGLSVFGLGRHDWGDIHFYLAMGLIGLGLLHLVLHWQWLWRVAAAKRSWLLLAGLVPGPALVLAVWLVPVRDRGADRHQASSAPGAVIGAVAERSRGPHGPR